MSRCARIYLSTGHFDNSSFLPMRLQLLFPFSSFFIHCHALLHRDCVCVSNIHTTVYIDTQTHSQLLPMQCVCWAPPCPLVRSFVRLFVPLSLVVFISSLSSHSLQRVVCVFWVTSCFSLSSSPLVVLSRRRYHCHRVFIMSSSSSTSSSSLLILSILSQSFSSLASSSSSSLCWTGLVWLLLAAAVINIGDGLLSSATAALARWLEHRARESAAWWFVTVVRRSFGMSSNTFAMPWLAMTVPLAA
jgi:hypothetical protein